MASLSPRKFSVPTSWPEKPANATKQDTTTATPSPAASATILKPTSPVAVMGLASKNLANANKQATRTATPATTPKPTSPAALPAMGLACKTPAVKTDTSSLKDELHELLLNDNPTEEEIKAWSLENYGTYRKSDYISLIVCNVAPNER
jgi:hypothetical protein